MSMPSLDVDKLCNGLSADESKLIRACFHRGKLRAAKPFRHVDRRSEKADFEGRANYVWRMLCFDYCGFRPHNCMPITAGWDIPGDYSGQQEITKALDELIKRAEANLPVTLQRGIMQWARAMYG